MHVWQPADHCRSKSASAIQPFSGNEAQSTPTELCHSAQRWRAAATLGGDGKTKSTLKELCPDGVGLDATPSALMIWWGRFPRVAPKAFGATTGLMDLNPACSRFIGVGILKTKSGGGPPQSKTLPRRTMISEMREASWSAPAFCALGTAPQD